MCGIMGYTQLTWATLPPELWSKQIPFEGALGTPGNLSGKSTIKEKVNVYHVLTVLQILFPGHYIYYSESHFTGETQTGEVACP